MTITLPKELERFVSDQVGSGQYPNPDEVVSHGLRLLQERAEHQQQKLEDLRQAVAVALKEVERGEVAPFDPMETLARIQNRSRRTE